MQILFLLVDFFLLLSRVFGWLCLLPTIIVVYASIGKVNEFQGGLLGIGAANPWAYLAVAQLHQSMTS